MRRILSLCAVLLASCILAGSAAAQDAAPVDSVTQTVTFDKSFPLVYRTIKSMMEARSCRVERDKYQENEETHLFKGFVRTEFCVFATGPDSTEDVMERFSAKIPYIRGAVWTAARAQYRFTLTELEEGKTQVALKSEISGFEEFVTKQMHFWESNGVLERALMAELVNAVAMAKSAAE